MIGVLGGSFDPIHQGHLQTASEVMQTLSLDEIRIVPSRMPPHRDGPIASIEQRVKLIQVALKSYKRMRIDFCEVEREGPSYTIDTLLHIGQETNQPLCLIIGQDAFDGFMRWHRWQAIIEVAHLVVMRRPGSNVIKDYGVLNRRIVHRPLSLSSCESGNIFFCDVSELDISSSQIRERLRQGADCHGLMPSGVLEWINKENIYN